MYSSICSKVKFTGLDAPANVQFYICDSTFTDDYHKLEGLERCDGILGMPFLEQFGVVCDFGTHNIYMRSYYANLVSTELDGEWIFESWDDGVVPRNDVSFTKSKWVFRGRSLRYYDGDSWAEFYVNFAPWACERQASERRIDITNIKTAGPCRGIYKMVGETLYVAISSNNYSRPSQFAPNRGESHIVIKLHRTK